LFGAARRRGRSERSSGRRNEAAATAPHAGVEEIVVTAQKRSEYLNEVPIAISAFGGEQLHELGITDTRDSEDRPGPDVFGEWLFGSDLYAPRRRPQRSQPDGQLHRRIYVDEQNLPFPVMSKGALLDLERVEVLKGPQGTLYGRNTTGGAINYVARRRPTSSRPA